MGRVSQEREKSFVLNGFFSFILDLVKSLLLIKQSFSLLLRRRIFWLRLHKKPSPLDELHNKQRD